MESLDLQNRTRIGAMNQRAVGSSRDDAAGQFQHAQEFGHGRDLVALVGHFPLAQHQFVALGPRADHVLDALVGVQRPAQRLAVQRDDFLRQGLPQTLRPAHETVAEGFGVQRGEEAIESVVAGNAAAQGEERLEPVALGAAEVLPVVETFAAAQLGTDGDDEEVDQIVILGAVDARVGQVLEMRDQAEFWMRLHPHSSKHTVQKYKANFAPHQF